ncbi:MAG: response regulator [Candidatus Glassbacteria bacterium]
MKGKRILIVDDDPQILTFLSDMLAEERYTLEISAGGEEALRKLEEKKFHLVISDVRMPGIDGFELLKAIKERFKKTKVILMTGYTDDYDISDALILGADDYITKPFDVSRVMLAVNNAFAPEKP